MFKSALPPEYQARREKQEKNKRESERFFTFVQILCNIET